MRVLLIIYLLIHSQFTFSQELDTKKKRSSFIDKTHDLLSDRILSFSDSIDQFFANERRDDVINRSQLRFSTTTVKREGVLPFTSGDLQYNLILPRTQRRLRLFVEGQGSNESEDKDSSVDENIDSSATSSGQTRTRNTSANKTSAGLRYIGKTAGIQTATDAGIRVNWPPQVFARLRLRRDVKLNIYWKLRPREELLWVDREGWRSTTNVDFDRKMNMDLLFRFVNKMQWNDNDFALNFTNGPSLFQKIDDTKGFSYHAHIHSTNVPTAKVENYLASINYRQLLYKKWFFWELTPKLEFPRELNFHRTTSMTIKFEVLIGDI